MSLNRNGDEVRITLQPQTSTDTEASLLEINVQMKDMHSLEESEKMSSHPVFCTHLDNHSPDLNFQAELKHLPFPLNVREAPLDKEQQSRFLDLIYDN